MSFADPPAAVALGAAAGFPIVGMTKGMTNAGPPRDTGPDPIGLGADARIFSGFAWNFARQPAQQKKYSFPLCCVLKRAVAVFTSIPQTGSFCLAGDDAAFEVSTGSRWFIVFGARNPRSNPELP